MKPCMLSEIIKGNMPFLMEFFKDDLAAYGMVDDTKCLNTAVMTMFLFLGKKALEPNQGVPFCDVENVKSRYAQHGDKSKEVLDWLGPSLLSPHRNKRVLYYVMITNEILPVIDSHNNKTVSFPGHVFVIDKSFDPTIQNNKYKIYQSYISKYNLQGAIDRKIHTMTFKDMVRFVCELNYFFDNIWDEKVAMFWKWFTDVDTTKEGPDNLMNGIISGKIFLCCQMIPIVSCTKELIHMIDEKMNSKKEDQEFIHKHIANVTRLKREIRDLNKNTNNKRKQNPNSTHSK